MFRFKLAEFFSGPGGMGYGAGLSKVKGSLIEHAWASDYDQDSCNTYKRNIKTKAVFCEKVENFFNLVDKKKIILPADQIHHPDQNILSQLIFFPPR